MDVEQASASIDALIERRASERSNGNALEEMYAESVRRHRERLRRENAAAWYVHFCGLADSLRASAEHYERRAEALMQEEGG